MYSKNKRVLAVILSEEISRFTVEGDRKGHWCYQFLFRKEAQFHPSLRSIFLYMYDILMTLYHSFDCKRECHWSTSHVHIVMIEMSNCMWDYHDGICEIQQDMGVKLLEFAKVLPSPIFQIGVFANVFLTKI